MNEWLYGTSKYDGSNIVCINFSYVYWGFSYEENVYKEKYIYIFPRIIEESKENVWDKSENVLVPKETLVKVWNIFVLCHCEKFNQYDCTCSTYS